MRKFSLLLLISTISFAQNLNEFKYAVVPSKFSFSKEPNEFNLNVLTKMFMEKYGFEAHLDSEILSDDFASTNCNKVYVNVIDNSSLFLTKIKVEIKNCKNNILATSEYGTSREKEYKLAYTKALRMAFENFGVLKMHKFQASQNVVVADKIDAIEKGFNPKKEVAQNQILEKKYNVIATENGFNLITVASDYTIFQIFKTSSKDVFIADRDKVLGVLIKKADSWFFEYYQNDKLVSEKVEVKF